MPQQVYPPPLRAANTEGNYKTLNDITNLSGECGTASAVSQESDFVHVLPGPNRSVKSGYSGRNRISERAVPVGDLPPPYKATETTREALTRPQIPFVLQSAPKPKRKMVINRLLPQKRSIDVSPSDARIEIGIAIPPDAVQYRKDSMQSEKSHPQTHSWRRSSNKSGSELKTPTIVITPVNDEFEASFNGLSQSSRRNGPRPPSSIYSRCTNGFRRTDPFDRPPPVPPLPNFAVRDLNTTQGARSDDAASTRSQKILPALPISQSTDERSSSICAAFDEELVERNDSRSISSSNRFSLRTRTPNSRSSQGWWNFVTSPFSFSFSPKSASRSFRQDSSPLPPGEQQLNADLPAKLPKDHALDESGSHEDNELRSAPATESIRRSSTSRHLRTPKRADTAPGALDLGNADAINIYTTPSHGSASSYYDRTRNYPSLIAQDSDFNLDRQLEPGWSPSQSVYRGSRSDISWALNSDNGGFSDMQIPTTGEAAPYYDSRRRFSDSDTSKSLDSDMASNSRPPNAAEYAAAGTSARGQPHVESPTSAPASVTPYRLDSASPLDQSAGHGHQNPHTPSSSERSMVLDDGVYSAPADKGSGRVMGGYDTDTTTRPWRTDGAAYRASPVTAEIPRGLVDPAQHSFSEGQAAQYESRESLSSDASTDFQGNSHEKELPFSEREPYDTRFRSEKTGDYDLENDRSHSVPWYRRMLGLLVLIAALLIVSLIVLLVLFVPEHHAQTQVQARWLNLTGFPPLPTGVATVVGTKLVKEVDGCVDREALWSCAVPPGEGLSTTQPDQPNFRFLIRFRNGTSSNDTLVEPTNSTLVKRESGRAANAGAIVRRDAWSNFLYTASPPPPSTDDQDFIGRTTDDVSPPLYAGEETPFYISLIDPIALQPMKRLLLQKRNSGFHYPYPTPSDFKSTPTNSSHSSSNPSSSDTSNAAESVPSPALQVNGEPAPPKLYPFAYAQPLRLFNRGQGNEHYGFYTYFDRSVFLSSWANGTFPAGTSTGARASSNVGLDHARSVCTWSDSRLLVSIWTGKPDVTELAPSTNTSIPMVDSTANDLKSPGSFPYSVSISLDRHGGEASMKGFYCWDIDENHHIIHDSGTWIKENRAFNGKIIKPAEIPTNGGMPVPSDNTGDGKGVDGGTSGCQCQWQNFP